jgi:hypothetical protein
MADLPPEWDDLVAAIKTAVADSYRRGREDGLAVAEAITSRLANEPDTDEKAKIRQWANAAIQKARLCDARR